MKVKGKIAMLAITMIGALSMVFANTTVIATPKQLANNVLKEALVNEVEKVVTKDGGYQNLTIDKTFNVENVTFEGKHSVYTSLKEEKDGFLFEGKYVTSVKYNGDEIANIYYTDRRDVIQDVRVVLDDANKDLDVLVNIAIKQMPSIENKEEISFYIPNDKTTVAFTENTYKMFVLKDEYASYTDYISEEADGSKTIQRQEFLELNQSVRSLRKGLTTKTTVTLQVILILLFAILAILAFLSYILINKDKINKGQVATTKVEETVKSKRGRKPGSVNKIKTDKK